MTVQPCVGDTRTASTPADAIVDLQALLTVLGAFGGSADPWMDGDTNGDGAVDLSDLLEVLGNFGGVCS